MREGWEIGEKRWDMGDKRVGDGGKGWDIWERRKFTNLKLKENIDAVMWDMGD